MSEWIKWEGGECPVSGSTRVTIKFSDGDMLTGVAGSWKWSHVCGGKGGDIVAYRVKETQEEAYEETDKPIGDSALNVQIGGDHYKHFQIQPVTFINANEMDFLQGSVVKYISRHKMKGRRQDVEKAIHFCNMILELQYAEGK